MKCKLISVIFKMECQNLKLFYATWTSMKRYSVQKKLWLYLLFECCYFCNWSYHINCKSWSYEAHIILILELQGAIAPSLLVSAFLERE